MGNQTTGCPTCNGTKTRQSERLFKKYGARPKRYASYLDGRGNEAQKRFAKALPKVVAHAKAVARRHGIDVTKEEIATNILSEGAVLALKENIYDQLSGFGTFGIDTIVDRKRELASFLDPETQKLVNEPRKISEQKNERGQTVRSLRDLTLEEGMYANASMYVWSKSRFANDLSGWGLSIKNLPPEAQFFWSTMYFNAGPTQGRAHLVEWGVEEWQNPWEAEDSDFLYGGESRYNAHWRTATFESLSGALDTEPSPSSSTPSRDSSIPPWQ